ncbi:MAG: hypothetical protein AB7S48_00635 [Bacteroidales bacterium]
MKIEVVKITDKILLLIFENQQAITSTFLRFQEHYESPEFRGKVFTLNEFKEWYSSLKGEFSYYTDWNGFNIPSYVLKPFYEGQFNPLSEKEKMLLDLLKNFKDKFYVIGIHKNIKSVSDLLAHEVAHGLFYTDRDYHNSVTKILSEFNLNDIKTELTSKGGYHEEVLDDEVHAYSLDSINELNAEIPLELHQRLSENYLKSLEKNKAYIPDL